MKPSDTKRNHAGPDRIGADGRMCPRHAVAIYWFLVTVLLFLIPASRAAGAGMPVSESQLKAAWLLNFAKLTEWPPEALSHDRQPIVIGVLGDEGFEEQLTRSLAGKVAHGRSLTVRRVENAKEALACHMLFMGAISPERKEAFLRQLINSPVLTIDDSEGADGAGCILKFLRLDNKLRFHVDLESANAAGVKLNPKLLEVAHSVKGKLQQKPEKSP